MPLERDLADLARRLPGRVSPPGTPGWEAARLVFSRAGRLRTPLASVRPANRDDVATVLAWAAETGVTVSPRSGGHAFDGLAVQNHTVLLDLRDLNRVTLRPDGCLEAMPAVTNIGIAETLETTDRALPIGDCPTVALGGLVTGGGFGYAGRQFGLTCDHLVEATVALPDGSLVRAAENENSDLFWACRGGGGSAGVVTDMVLETRRVPRIAAFTITWQWAHAVEAVALHAALTSTAPRTLDLKLKFRTTGADRFMDTASAGTPDSDPGTPLVHLDGQFLGPRAEAEELLAPVLNHVAVISSDIREMSFHDAEVSLTPLSMINEPAPPTQRPMRVASDFVAEPLDGGAGEIIVGVVDALQRAPDLHGGGVLIEPSGGQIAEPPTGSAAFLHRHTTALVQWELFHDLPLEPAQRARLDSVLTEARAALGARLTGGRYVNYGDMLDTPEHWWGTNLPRLRAIAAKADPGRVIASRLNPGHRDSP
jgi:FAD/FMN-containing dehydrogenase